MHGRLAAGRSEPRALRKSYPWPGVLNWMAPAIPGTASKSTELRDPRTMHQAIVGVRSFSFGSVVSIEVFLHSSLVHIKRNGQEPTNT